MTIWYIGAATVISTYLGGLFAIRFRDKLHLILGFSAGAVIGVAFFDLLPEAISLGQKFIATSYITTTMAVGFIVFMLVDRLVTVGVRHNQSDLENKTRRGQLGAGSLSLHSFLDGMAIGLAFKVSPAVGIIVAAAVLTHDFSDGINTVSLILKNDGNRRQAMRWLLLDALTPLAGIGMAYFFTPTDRLLSLILALFCGFFLYIGASDLLPESQHRHPARWTSLMTVLGALVIYLAVQFAQL